MLKPDISSCKRQTLHKMYHFEYRQVLSVAEMQFQEYFQQQIQRDIFSQRHVSCAPKILLIFTAITHLIYDGAELNSSTVFVHCQKSVDESLLMLQRAGESLNVQCVTELYVPLFLVIIYLVPVYL